MEITKENLLKNIAASESETIEFKEKFGDEALETVGAFANARGGNILIGIKNSGEICGVQIGKKSLEDIANGTLIEQLDTALSWFRERLETEFIIKGGAEREVRWEYPLNAIREAIINVLCHRDYTSLAHSQIRLYDDHLVMWNAGGLPTSLTTDNLFQEHDSIPRNRIIANAFFYSGLIERWGSGTIRIAEELSAANLPAPEFESQSGQFRVTFYKELLNEKQLKKLGLSARQIKAVSYARAHGSISNSEYQNIANVSERTATRDLNSLKEKGIFILEGTAGRGITYRIKAP